MSPFSDLLDTFDDGELAYFWRYKVPTYLPAAQERIRDYLSHRGLTTDQLTQRSFLQPILRPGGCPRCGSVHIKRSEVAWILGGMDTVPAAFREECQVCGSVLDDPNGNP